MSYQPSQKILANYANILVNFALSSGKGIAKGDVVRLSVPEAAKPFLYELYQAVLKAGGHPMISFLPNDDKDFNFSKTFFNHASPDQLKFLAKKYYKGMVEQVDHTISILAETDKQALKEVDPVKIMTKAKASKPVMDWFNAKENQGKFTWVVALYGTEAMADEAKLSLSEYWQQIKKACFLNNPDPIAKWKQVSGEISQIKDKLNALKIDKVHIKGPDVDLYVTIGKNRKWIGGGGRNIPSFEIFTSPDWRGTNGWINFNQPLYRYGNLIKNIKLEFKNGVVTKFSASQNQNVLEQMIKTKNTDKIGEFSLTDSRHSQVTKFMAETLYDENTGGEQGNTHIALGMSYKDCLDGDPTKLTDKQWQDLGFNDSAIHTDIVSTARKTVTAALASGKKMVIYKDGKFTV